MSVNTVHNFLWNLAKWKTFRLFFCGTENVHSELNELRKISLVETLSNIYFRGRKSVKGTSFSN